MHLFSVSVGHIQHSEINSKEPQSPTGTVGGKMPLLGYVVVTTWQWFLVSVTSPVKMLHEWEETPREGRGSCSEMFRC